MHEMFIISVLICIFALFLFHCWCVSVLISHRFGLLRSLFWLLPLVLLPLIGPLIFVFATRSFRQDRRPSRKVQAAWFAGVSLLFFIVSGYVSVQNFQEFNRGAADAQARNELQSALKKVEEFSKQSRRLPETLKEASYDGPPATIHVTYRLNGPTAYEMSSWNDKGAAEFHARSGSTEIIRERR